MLCDVTLSSDDVDAFVEKIDADYVVAWILDGLPAAVRMIDEATSEITYEHGFPLGFTAAPAEEKRFFLFSRAASPIVPSRFAGAERDDTAAS